jgi:hypothetical protein
MRGTSGEHNQFQLHLQLQLTFTFLRLLSFFVYRYWAAVPLGAYLILLLCRYAGITACTDQPDNDDSSGNRASSRHAWEQQPSQKQIEKQAKKKSAGMEWDEQEDVGKIELPPMARQKDLVFAGRDDKGLSTKQSSQAII